MALLATLALQPVMFAPHSGWYTGHGATHACTGASAARCLQASSWASTRPWRDCAECLPHRTIATLPRDGIILQVTISTAGRHVGRRGGAWPPTIRAGNLSGIEGVSSRYGVFQRSARYGRRDVYVWAFFGRARPTASQLAAANAELRTVHL